MRHQHALEILGKDHCCLVEDTKILAQHGKIRISELKIGDKVWTRKGLRPITKIWQTGYKETWKNDFMEGTADHPLIRIMDLVHGDEANVGEHDSECTDCHK